MSEGWNIAVLGATGAMGEALLETLAERQFPVGEILSQAKKLPLPGLKKRPTQVAW